LSNNNEILDGINDLLKNIDLEQFTSLISNLNVKGADTNKKDSIDPKFDLTSLNSLISNIDFDEVRSLLSGLNLDNLKNLNIEELQTALNQVTERIQNYQNSNKSE
jgi:hypothetical protein